MKYEFPEENEWTTPKDVIGWFSYYWKEKNGKWLPNYLWGRYIGVVSREIKKVDISLDDLRYLLWYVANTKPNMKSIAYLFYFTDELEEAKELKEQYDEIQEEEDEEVEYINDKKETKKERKDRIANEKLGEFMEG